VNDGIIQREESKVTVAGAGHVLEGSSSPAVADRTKYAVLASNGTALMVRPGSDAGLISCDVRCPGERGWVRWVVLGSTRWSCGSVR